MGWIPLKFSDQKKEVEKARPREKSGGEPPLSPLGRSDRAG
jgi:hypothetical protein